MLPGLPSPMLLASPAIVGPAVRRKLIQKYVRTNNSSPSASPTRYMFIGIMAGTSAQSGGSTVPESGSHYSFAKLSKLVSTWSTRGSANSSSTLALWFNLPDGVDLPSGTGHLPFNVRWSGHRTSNGSLTIPTSTMVRKKSIAFAAVADGYLQKTALSWSAPEGADQMASRSGNNGTTSLIRASLFADGAPDYDITVNFTVKSRSTAIAAIMEWD